MIDINLNKVSKSYGFDIVLNNIDLTINKGEKIALIGPNGSGKSTILKMIAGYENINSGDISIRKGISIGYLSQIPEDNDILVKDYIYNTFKELLDMKEKLEYLEKNLGSDIKSITKYTKLQEKFIDMGGYEFETKISKVLAAFEITKEMLERNFNTLSGGEKTIVNLATILLKNPSILLLDEPTNHLDIETLEWLENFLIEYKGTILLISHDRYFLDKVATKTILLENGHTKIYFGNYSYFLEEDERRTLAEFENYKTQQKQIEKMKESIKKLREFGRLAGNEMFFKRAKSIEKRLEKIEVLEKRESKKLPIKINSCSKTGKDVLVIKNLNKSYGDNVIFNNFNMGVFGGEKVQLKGKNGSGKSTLIKIILGNDNDFSGEIKINPSVKIGYIPQEIKFDNESNTILEYFLENHSGSETQVRTFLAKYMFYGENVFKRLKELSGGERVRLLIAKLVLKQTNFLILDEPTNHLDISTRELLEENLKEYKGTILFVSHDRYFANKIVEREINL